MKGRRRARRRRFALAGVVICAAVAAAALGLSRMAAGAGNVTLNGVDQTELQNCLTSGHNNCQNVVPRLQNCMAARLSCNQDAYDQRSAAHENASAATGGPMTESQAIAAAIRAAVGSAPPSAAAAKEMTLTGYVQWSGDHPAYPGMQSTDLLWVVTVQAGYMEDGGPAVPPTVVSPYAVVYDASTHQDIALCAGPRCPTIAP